MHERRQGLPSPPSSLCLSIPDLRSFFSLSLLITFPLQEVHHKEMVFGLQFILEHIADRMQTFMSSMSVDEPPAMSLVPFRPLIVLLSFSCSWRDRQTHTHAQRLGGRGARGGDGREMSGESPCCVTFLPPSVHFPSSAFCSCPCCAPHPSWN